MKFSAVTALLLLSSSVVFGEDFSVKNCKINFETTGQPVLVKILGKADGECTGNLKIEGGKVVSSEFKLDLNKIDTGIPLRNRHLRENYLKTQDFPNAVLKITKIDDLEAQRSGAKKGTSKFEGDLEMHGVTSPVGDSSYSVDGKKVTAKFEVELANWKIEKPSFMGVKIVDKVYLTVSFDY